MHKLILLGELDHRSAATLEAAIESLCERDVAGIELDLSKLTSIDATGIAVVAFRCRWCERHGFGFVLVPGAPAIQHAFAQAGALARLPFRAEALERGQASERVAVTEEQADETAEPAAQSYVHAGSRAQRTLPAVT